MHAFGSLPLIWNDELVVGNRHDDRCNPRHVNLNCSSCLLRLLTPESRASGGMLTVHLQFCWWLVGLVPVPARGALNHIQH